MGSRTSSATLHRAAAATLLLASLLPAPGCNIVAPVASLVAGPPKTQAAHKLDKASTAVIFIDDRASQAPRRSLRNVVATEAERTLIEKNVLAADQLFPSAAAARAAQGESYDAPISIAEVGRRVGADRVIYVEMTSFSLSRDGVTLSPSASARVKVIDAATGQRIFPDDAAGYPVTAQLPRGAQAPASLAARAQVEQALAKALGVQIARVFFTHERDALSGRLND